METHIALKLDIGRCSVMVIMLPRPKSCFLLALGYIAVSILFRIDERDISVICLMRGIDNLKYALGSRKGCKDYIKLL